MAPVFPTTLAMVGNAFPRMSGTAIGFVITCGWAGLAVSSRLIGAIAGGRSGAAEEGAAAHSRCGGADGWSEPGDLVGDAVGAWIVLLRDLKGETGET